MPKAALRLLLVATCLLFMTSVGPAAAAGADADLAVTMTDAPDPVGPNGTVTFVATVANNGPDTATGVSFRLENADGMTFSSLTSPAGWSCTTPAVGTAGAVQCTRASLPAGSPQDLTVELVADPAAVGLADRFLSTTATVTGSSSDPSGANDSSTQSTLYLTPDADLQVTQSESPDPVTAGETTTATVGVTNAGPDDAPGVSLTIPSPGAMRFVSLSSPAGWSCTTPAVDSSGTVTCTRASLVSGGSGSFTLVRRVAPSAAASPLSTTASIDGAVEDPDPANDDATETTQVVRRSDVRTTLTATPKAVAGGGELTATVGVSTAGPSTATGVVVKTTLPPGTTLVSATPSSGSCTGTTTVTCTLGTLGAPTTIGLRATSGADVPDGTVLSWEATATADEADPTPTDATARDTVTVSNPADLALAVASPERVEAGQDVEQRLTVTNGGGPAQAVVLTVPIPAGTAFKALVQDGGPAATCTTPAVGAGGEVRCQTPTLARGATQVLRLVLSTSGAAAGSPIAATARVISATRDVDAPDQDVRVAIQVSAAPQPPGPAAAEPPVLRCEGVAVRLYGLVVRGRRVRLEGLALSRFAGARVQLRTGGRTVATTTVGPDGTFAASAPKPRSADATFTAVLDPGGASQPLRVQRRLGVTSVRATPAGVRLAGTLAGRHGRQATITVRRQTDCAASTLVRRITTDAAGRFAVTVPRPDASAGLAVYRLATANGGSSYSLPVVVRAAG